MLLKTTKCKIMCLLHNVQLHKAYKVTLNIACLVFIAQGWHTLVYEQVPLHKVSIHRYICVRAIAQDSQTQIYTHVQAIVSAHDHRCGLSLATYSSGY